ncbi:hypothetical protein [Nannocystis punicea]|uniref:Uncharacterized protein n=1 Tax=Nannocystis punicea TaxID=2995304 RepID=A0ABY7H9W1_9BACT|nr:hypothetical protein [Nannocystis poenicansa]WAS96016.1 hypothetical protein O0S08_07605 [Nannocystis poenicansa]
MQTLPRILVILPALLAFGCLAPKGDLGQYTDSDGTTDGTGPDSGTTAASAGDSDSGPDDGPPECVEPADPTEELAGFTFTPALAGDSEGFAGDCQVTAIEVLPEGAKVELGCGEQVVEIDLLLDEPLTQFAVGDPLVLDYRVQMSFGTSDWFTLRRPAPDGTLLLGALKAEALAPPGSDDFFAPLSLVPQEGLCPTAITCDDMDEPIAVEVTHGDDVALVFPTRSAAIGDATYRVGVTVARKHHDEVSDGQGGVCQSFDIPEYFYRLMFHHLGD